MNSSFRTARQKTLASQQVKIGTKETQHAVEEARLAEAKQIRSRIIQATD